MQLVKVTALIPCAGQGKRMGASINKPFIEVAGKPIIYFALKTFQDHPQIHDIVMIARDSEISYCWEEIVKKYNFDKVKKIIVGGKERQESVALGLKGVAHDTKWIVVHDGVRPLLSAKTLSYALSIAFEKGSAVVGVPAKDTIKMIEADMSVIATPKRESLWLVQTPQIFPREVLMDAYKKAKEKGWSVTDDSSLVEKMGYKVYMAKGEYNNIKITTPEDIDYLRASLRMEE